MATKNDVWQYSIVKRGDHDDMATTIPCCECSESCGGSTLNVPVHWAVVKYENDEPKLVCETCTKNAGAEFIWNVAKAIDDVDCLYYMVPDNEHLTRIADLVDYTFGEITAGWRHMAALDL